MDPKASRVDHAFGETVGLPHNVTWLRKSCSVLKCSIGICGSVGKVFACKYEDLGSNPQHSCKSVSQQGTVEHRDKWVPGACWPSSLDS